MNTKTPSDSALRRKARRRGLKITKLRENSRWYNEYGPLMIADAGTNGALQGMTLDEAVDWVGAQPLT